VKSTNYYDSRYEIFPHPPIILFLLCKIIRLSNLFQGIRNLCPQFWRVHVTHSTKEQHNYCKILRNLMLRLSHSKREDKNATELNA